MPPRRPTAALPLLPTFALLASSLLFGACAEGGDEDRPTCIVQIDQETHAFTIIARPNFPAYPTTSGDIGTSDGSIAFEAMNCAYTWTETGGLEVAASEYSLEEDGTLSLLIPTVSGSLVYRGAYGLEGDTRHLFLTDRVGNGIGLLCGTQIVAGAAPPVADFVGDWHLLAMHLIVPDASAPADPNLVGVALHAEVAIDANGAITGTGTESEAGAVNIRSQNDDFVPQADGRLALEFEVDSIAGLKPDYERGFLAGGGRVDATTRTAIFGLDPLAGASDSAAGLLAMLPHRDPTGFDAGELVGTYKLGLWTIYVDPAASGTDSSLGTLELRADDTFELVAETNTLRIFRYEGTYTPQANGSLQFDVDGIDELWHGAFDQGYDTVVFVDPEFALPQNRFVLGFGIALRAVEPTAGS